MNDDKRRHRQMKRDIKKAGTRSSRRQLKRQLDEDPAHAHEGEVDYGRNSSAPLNGNDRDATRSRDEEE
jgi:hypothetical protein